MKQEDVNITYFRSKRDCDISGQDFPL